MGVARCVLIPGGRRGYSAQRVSKISEGTMVPMPVMGTPAAESTEPQVAQEGDTTAPAGEQPATLLGPQHDGLAPGGGGAPQPRAPGAGR